MVWQRVRLVQRSLGEDPDCDGNRTKKPRRALPLARLENRLPRSSFEFHHLLTSFLRVVIWRRSGKFAGATIPGFYAGRDCPRRIHTHVADWVGSTELDRRTCG